MKGKPAVMSPEMIEKVIRSYKKGVSIQQMVWLGISSRKLINEILEKEGIHKKTKTGWQEHRLELKNETKNS